MLAEDNKSPRITTYYSTGVRVRRKGREWNDRGAASTDPQPRTTLTD